MPGLRTVALAAAATVAVAAFAALLAAPTAHAQLAICGRVSPPPSYCFEDDPPEPPPAAAPRLETGGLGSFRDLKMTANSAPQTVQVAARETVTTTAFGGPGESVRLRGSFKKTCQRGSVTWIEDVTIDGSFGAPPKSGSWTFSCASSSDRLLDARLEIRAEARNSAGQVASTATATFVFTSAEQHYSTSVSENMGERQTDITVLPGDFVRIVGGGSIWAGVWLTGENGPAGWPAPFASSPPYPHATYRYSLLAYLDGRWAMPLPGFTEGHGWFWVGDVKYVTYLGPPTRLKIGINDDVPGNGSGHFTANVMVQRGK